MNFHKDAGLDEFKDIEEARKKEIKKEIKFFYSMKEAFTDNQIYFNFQELHEQIVQSLMNRERRN